MGIRENKRDKIKFFTKWKLTSQIRSMPFVFAQPVPSLIPRGHEPTCQSPFQLQLEPNSVKREENSTAQVF